MEGNFLGVNFNRDRSYQRIIGYLKLWEQLDEWEKEAIRWQEQVKQSQ